MGRDGPTPRIDMVTLTITDQDGNQDQEVVGIRMERRQNFPAVVALEGPTWAALLMAINYQLRPDYTGGRPYELQALIEEEDPDLARVIRDVTPHLRYRAIHRQEMAAAILEKIKTIVEDEMTILRAVDHHPVLRSAADQEDLDRRISILHRFHRLVSL